MARPTVAWQESFTFGEKQIFVQAVEMDGMTTELIEGWLEERVPDYGRIRIATLQRVIRKLTVDGKDVNLEPDPSGRSRFPRVWDKGEQVTLTHKLLSLLVNKHEPELAEQFPAPFEKYLFEEEENPTTPTTQTPDNLSPLRGSTTEEE